MSEKANKDDIQHIHLGTTEWRSLVLGLVIGAIFGAMQLPIPVPNVVGGNLAITGVFIGMIIVGVYRNQVKFRKPPEER